MKPPPYVGGYRQFGFHARYEISGPGAVHDLVGFGRVRTLETSSTKRVGLAGTIQLETQARPHPGPLPRERENLWQSVIESPFGELRKLKPISTKHAASWLK